MASPIESLMIEQNKIHQSSSRSYRILIVEDSPLQARVLQDLLAEHHLHAEVANTGSIAITMAKTGRYELILMDMVLPDTSGLQLVSQLKTIRATCNIPIIILSGVTDKENIVEALTLGVNDYITKPYHQKELLMRTKLHLDVVQSQRELKELNHTKDKLFTMLAQDLKNPFHTLMGMTELLRKSTDDHKRAHYIEGIYSSTKTIYDFFENLVLWMSIKSQNHETYPEFLNLCELTEEVCDFFEQQANAKHITLKNKTDVKHILSGDYIMVNAILRNLISNAIKFTPGEGEVMITSHHAMVEGKPFIEVSIQDSGIGISEDRVPQIFRSEKVHSSPGTEGERGTGIGLLLCKEFVERNGGNIRLESEHGKGSVFIFQLPAIIEKQDLILHE